MARKGDDKRKEQAPGVKKQAILAALDYLGPEATLTEANNWISARHNFRVSGPRFNYLRQEYRRSKGLPPCVMPSAQQRELPRPTGPGSQSHHAQRAQANNDLLDLVVHAQALVAKLGKDDAKRLIEMV